MGALIYILLSKVFIDAALICARLRSAATETTCNDELHRSAMSINDAEELIELPH